MSPVPALVTLHVWRVATGQVPAALLRMATDRRRIRGTAQPPSFAKLLGTGDGRTFTVRDTTLRRWGLLATWATAGDAAAFEHSPVARGWGNIADERFRLDLRPLASRGRWSRQEPFGRPVSAPYDGPVVALTRARIAPRKLLTFWRAVPPVSADLHEASGLKLAIGVGEAPIGLQGTVSIWESPAALRAFAFQRPAHQVAIRRTTEERWYAEELFARFAVLACEGTVDGVHPLA